MGKFTRRTFLKLATAGAGFAIIESTFSPILRADELVKAGKSVSRTTGLPRRAVPSTCAMCPAGCGVLGFVEGNELVKIEGNPRDPNTNGRLCAKGQAGVNIVYNPDRLLYPIRRKGPRGSGSWVRITWDEALDELAIHLKNDMAKTDLALMGGVLEGTAGITGRFARAYGTTKILDEGALYTANKTAAQRATWGADFEVPDLSRARYILNFGANPAESHPLFVPIAQRLVEGQMSGAKLVTFDPRLSGTAARSAAWHPIRPGSDAFIALAMANVIVQRGLYDAAFVRQWLNVKLEDLARHLASYTTIRAEIVSGVRSWEVERLAIEFATLKPGAAISGNSVSQHPNGTFSEAAIALLNAITGNVDVRGGYRLPKRYTLVDPQPSPLPPRSSCAYCSNPAQFFDKLANGERLGVLISNMANPVFHAPNGDAIANTLKDENVVHYHVAFDSYLTETAVLADVVLPAATYLESWDVKSAPAFEGVPFVNIAQPVLKPLGESSSFNDAIIALAKKMNDGVAKFFSFSNSEEYVVAVLRGSLPAIEKNGGVSQLKRDGVWSDPAAVPVERSYESTGFQTSSGKFEVYTLQLAAQGRDLAEVEKASSSAGRDQYTLVTFQLPTHSYGRTANSMWLSEIAHDNPVWINTERAAAMGIKRGDVVKIQSEAGTIETHAWPTQAVRPDVLAIGVGVGHWASSRIAQAKLFKSAEPNTEHVWWAKHGQAVHPYSLIPVAGDPVGGGQSWVATPVAISKA